MLYSEIIAVCSQIHTKHINTLCGQNVELLNVRLVVQIVTTGLYGVKMDLHRIYRIRVDITRTEQGYWLNSHLTGSSTSRQSKLLGEIPRLISYSNVHHRGHKSLPFESIRFASSRTYLWAAL